MSTTLKEILDIFENEIDSNPMAIIQAVDRIEESGFGVDAVESMLLLIEKYDGHDWGSPGHFAHYMEQFYGKGYEDRLEASILRKPTFNTMSLLYRCANGSETDDELQRYLSIFKEIINRTDVNSNIIEMAKEYMDWLVEE